MDRTAHRRVDLDPDRTRRAPGRSARLLLQLLQRPLVRLDAPEIDGGDLNDDKRDHQGHHARHFVVGREIQHDEWHENLRGAAQRVADTVTA